MQTSVKVGEGCQQDTGQGLPFLEETLHPKVLEASPCPQSSQRIRCSQLPSLGCVSLALECE